MPSVRRYLCDERPIFKIYDFVLTIRLRRSHNPSLIFDVCLLLRIVYNASVQHIFYRVILGNYFCNFDIKVDYRLLSNQMNHRITNEYTM